MVFESVKQETGELKQGQNGTVNENFSSKYNFARLFLLCNRGKMFYKVDLKQTQRIKYWPLCVTVVVKTRFYQSRLLFFSIRQGTKKRVARAARLFSLQLHVQSGQNCFFSMR